MVTIKERTVDGRKYVYLSASATYRGETKVFEKSLGPSDTDSKLMERRKKFYSTLFSGKKELYMIYFEAKNTEMTYLPKGYALLLTLVKRQYKDYMGKLYAPDLEKYRTEFEVRYVHNTTAIEGNTLTLQETAFVLDRGLGPSNTKELREIHEVENYKTLMEYVKNYKRDISKSFILRLHEFVQRNIDDDSAGTFRKISVGIVGSQWEPPPAIIVEEEIDNLLKWYNDQKKIMHPLELAGVFHHRFLQIHPFKDGNGRVARELFNFILTKNEFPPIVIPVTRSSEYFQALAHADNENLIPLLKFFAEIIIEDYTKTVNGLMNDIKQSIGEMTPEERIEIVKFLMEYIHLTLPFLMTLPEDLGKTIARLMGYNEETNSLEVFQKMGLLPPANK